MNGAEQRNHRSVTQSLEKRVADVETCFMEMDKRQVELMNVVRDDIVKLQTAGENSTAEIRREQKAADILLRVEVNQLDRQIRLLRAWQEQTWGYRFHQQMLRIRAWLSPTT